MFNTYLLIYIINNLYIKHCEGMIYIKLKKLREFFLRKKTFYT